MEDLDEFLLDLIFVRPENYFKINFCLKIKNLIDFTLAQASSIKH